MKSNIYEGAVNHWAFKVMILLGSSRSNGNTWLVASEIAAALGCELVNLESCRISHYDYLHHNKDDDFAKLVEKIILAENLIFATPVYWYAMSAQMKTFFDRFTDLITIRKSLGRQLIGKLTFVVATGTEENLPEGFESPFKLTSNYFNMHYGGTFYCRFESDLLLPDDCKGKINSFLESVRKS